MKGILKEQDERDKLDVTNTFVEIYSKIQENQKNWKKTSKIYTYQSQTLNFLGRAAQKLQTERIDIATQECQLGFLGQLAFDGVDALRVLRSVRKRSSRLEGSTDAEEWAKDLKRLAELWVQMIVKIQGGFGQMHQKLQAMAQTLVMVKKFRSHNISLQGALQKEITRQMTDLKLKKFIEEESGE